MTARRLRWCAALLALVPSACFTTPVVLDPTVVVHARGGDELGVATDLGIVFVGRGQRQGEVDYTVFFNDGPSRERSTIEPLSTDLLLLEPELRLPAVKIGFPELEKGQRVIVRGRRGRDAWERTATVATNRRVKGLLLERSGLGNLRNSDMGAGVYVEFEDSLVLVGLVRGRISLPSGDGESREYVAVAGARELIGLGLHGLPTEYQRIPADRQDALR